MWVSARSRTVVAIPPIMAAVGSATRHLVVVRADDPNM